MTKPIEFADFPQSLLSLAPFGPYRAVVKRVVDGDSIWVLIDLGLNQYAFESIRLRDVFAPEINQGTPESIAAGQRAKVYLESLLPVGTQIVVETRKDAASFGRY